MTDLTGIKKRAVTGHCNNEDIQWLINEVERLSVLIGEKEKKRVELGKQSKNSAKNYADVMDKQFKELTSKWKAELNKVEKLLAETNDELIRAKKKDAETQKQIARIQRIINEMMNLDTRLH
jgi:septal ring factor EnvC (AmiA/AmiB activator)